jgi:transmembrane sensor
LTKPVQLVAGRRLQFDSAASRAVVSDIEAQAVGEWREGRLTYDSAPLQLVASDLARYAGTDLVVPDALAQRRFSGTLFIGDGDSAIRDLAQLMELEVHRDGDAYRLEPAG